MLTATRIQGRGRWLLQTVSSMLPQKRQSVCRSKASLVQAHPVRNHAARCSTPPSSTITMLWPGRSRWYLQHRAGQAQDKFRSQVATGQAPHGRGQMVAYAAEYCMARSEIMPATQGLQCTARCVGPLAVRTCIASTNHCTQRAHQHSTQLLSGMTTAEPHAIRYLSRPGGKAHVQGLRCLSCAKPAWVQGAAIEPQCCRSDRSTTQSDAARPAKHSTSIA